jgi:hypothetical protein
MNVEINVGIVVDEGTPVYLATVKNGVLDTAGRADNLVDAVELLSQQVEEDGHKVIAIHHIEY